MVLYGYTIGDEDINPSQGGEQVTVYRFPISPLATTPQRVGEINAGSILNADLEGLGTNPTTQRASAVNEARGSGTTAIDPTVIRVDNVDQPFAPATASPTRTPSDLRRFGVDSGADFNSSALYNISGNDDTRNGTVGSSLYRITTANPGTISLVDAFGPATTAAQRQGTQPTNSQFADGLAIDNLNPGSTRAFASDFSTLDGDGNQLYKVDLLTGELSAPIALRTPSGQALNADSGLAFTNSGSQRLLALLETGAVYEITGYQDELAASGLGLGSAGGTNGAGFATATLLGNVNLPTAGGQYEGFTIVNE
ncbi:water stress protein WSP1 [Nostoc sp. CHAB 5784]|uniref:water stress protein WSP1 n=1 Tax=Nostoc mirabile TaxID=2907820 RepID=UPI001E5BD37F|nr:water stress protein WSP1 [Nostoc mirabile]MCC5667158.1 water stress protein WSP1 [Nostoc mirabile CHAB5784]